MEHRSHSPKVKKIIVILSAILIFFVTILLSVILVINNYIHKINLVSVSEVTQQNVLQSTTEVQFNPNSTIDEDGGVIDRSSSDSPPETVNSIENEIRRNMEDNSKPILDAQEIFNILLIGSDTRISGDTGRSDAMILVSVNKATKTIIVTSFLRDIYLKIPGYHNNRLNAAYALGGSELLMESIEQNFRITIDRFASIDFFAFIDMVDAVGGVTIDVTQEELSVINTYVKEINQLTGQSEEKDCLTTEGKQLLNGKQALGYARNRYTGNNDFERTARQRRVLEQIMQQVKNTSISELNEMLQILLPQVTTNLSEGELFTLILSLPSYTKYDFEQWSIPMADSYTCERIRGMAVLGIDFEKNITKLQEKIYNHIP